VGSLEARNMVYYPPEMEGPLGTGISLVDTRIVTVVRHMYCLYSKGEAAG
jgi:hypothetical protein